MTKFWKIAAILGVVVILIIIFSTTMQPNEEKNDEIMQTENSVATDASTTTEAVTTGEIKSSNTMSDAVFTTNYGTFTIELAKEKAPKTVANFIKLAQSGFYDGQRFHRVIDGFMIQGGDPLSKDVEKKAMWGTGGPGYQFADEFGQGLSNVVGTIAMANSGPNTNGSQFFVNVNDNIFLDGKHAVFGHVTSGLDVVMKISKVEKDKGDKPLEDVVIEKVVIK